MTANDTGSYPRCESREREIADLRRSLDRKDRELRQARTELTTVERKRLALTEQSVGLEQRRLQLAWSDSRHGRAFSAWCRDLRVLEDYLAERGRSWVQGWIDAAHLRGGPAPARDAVLGAGGGIRFGSRLRRSERRHLDELVASYNAGLAHALAPRRCRATVLGPPAGARAPDAHAAPGLLPGAGHRLVRRAPHRQGVTRQPHSPG